ncbi:hypothetical protein N7488_004517 [Penicillium malachiteum]|nr:hypothetical protein N7488_004517 [Penicillium malachiteum]
MRLSRSSSESMSSVNDDTSEAAEEKVLRRRLQNRAAQRRYRLKIRASKQTNIESADYPTPWLDDERAVTPNTLSLDELMSPPQALSQTMHSMMDCLEDALSYTNGISDNSGYNWLALGSSGATGNSQVHTYILQCSNVANL